MTKQNLIKRLTRKHAGKTVSGTYLPEFDRPMDLSTLTREKLRELDAVINEKIIDADDVTEHPTAAVIQGFNVLKLKKKEYSIQVAFVLTDEIIQSLKEISKEELNNRPQTTTDEAIERSLEEEDGAVVSFDSVEELEQLTDPTEV